ncbi:hypothetical protein DFO62_12664 [Serratia fonticola]|nr:hypothetical protein DFO62_12664 [Serratia fonticola]
MATPSATGPNSPSSACSPAVPASWAFVVTVAPHPTVPMPTSSARAASPKPAAAVASRPPSSGLPNSSTSCPTATGNISPLLCPICCGCSSTTIGHCLTTCFAAPPALCSAGHANRAFKWVSSARSILMAGSSISIRIYMSPLPAVALTSNTTSGDSCSLKRKRSSKFGATPSFTCCATTMHASIPALSH